MKPRSSTLAASALTLIVGCSFPSTPSAVEAQRPGPAAAPAVAAAGPRYPSSEVVFAPEIPAALRPARAATAAAPRRGLIFAVGADPATGEEDLPPVPEPEGWIPAPEAGPAEEPAEEVLVFAEEPAVFEEEATDEGTYDEESETAIVEEVRYIEAVEYETETIETGVPVLVIQGYSSWGCGNYPVVRSCRGFDPCFTPRRGASWEPVDYDPCWNACKDPNWTSWNRVDEERDRRVGPVVTGKREGAPHRDAPKAREEPVARQEPPAPAPAPTPAVRTPRTIRPEPAVVVIPPPPAPRREPVARASREALRTGGSDEPAPAPRTTPTVRRTVHPPAPATPAAEPEAEPEARPARTRVQRTAPEPAGEPRAEPVRQPHRVAEQPRPEPVREPAREHPARVRERDRTPEVQAPPPPPAPPPAPAPAPAHGGGGKRGR